MTDYYAIFVWQTNMTFGHDKLHDTLGIIGY